MAKLLTMNKVAEIRRLRESGEMVPIDIMEKFGISHRRFCEIIHDFTEREIYKLYYEGLTPKFISLKLGVDKNEIEYYLSDGMEVEISSEYTYEQWEKDYSADRDMYDINKYSWKKQRQAILEKGKKCCVTKAEQEAKVARLLGNEIEAALNKEAILNPEVLKRVADHLGYKDMLYFKKAMQACGVYNEELEGIFKKILNNK